MSIKVCSTELFSATRAKSFDVQGLHIFIVENDGELSAYVNSCPHRKIALDWGNDQFLDYHQELIQCATHGALFDIASGLCVSGPCAGQSLTSVPIKTRGNDVYIDTDDKRWSELI